jgi:hypothetical protein
MLSTSDPSPYRQETALRPRLRSRAARAADLSGLRFTDEEITAALKPTGGRVAAAQRLLTMTAGVSVGSRYVTKRVKVSPELSRLVHELRMKSWMHVKLGRACPHCGGLLEAKKF